MMAMPKSAGATVFFSLLLALAACGGGGGSSSGGGGGGGGSDPGPALQSIEVSPAAAMIQPAQVVALSAVGNYDDGSKGSVAAAWTGTDPGVATLSASEGSSITVTGVADGIVTVTASFGGFTADCEVTVNSIPVDPMPVYGLEGNTGTITEYPPMGGGAPTPLCSLGGTGSGFLRDAAGANFYVVNYTGVHRYEPATGTASLLTPLPSDSNGHFGLDADSQGMIYTQGFGSGEMRRIDPANGSIVTVGTSGNGMVGLEVGADDMPYSTPLATSLGQRWISRFDLTTNTAQTWALVPSSVTGMSGFVLPMGLAINPTTGETFIGDGSDNRIFRYLDVNGDGDALDAGEEVVFGEIPTQIGGSYMVWGICMAGGGTVLVNAQPANTSGLEGIYWLKDDNGDGDAADAGEVVLYNSNFVDNGFDTGCMAAPE